MDLPNFLIPLGQDLALSTGSRAGNLWAETARAWVDSPFRNHSEWIQVRLVCFLV